MVILFVTPAIRWFSVHAGLQHQIPAISSTVNSANNDGVGCGRSTLQSIFP
jgi:hypothetical protein